MFTAYIPFLKDSGITDSEVFLAYTILHLSKIFYLPFNHRLVGRGGEQAYGRLAYIPRLSGITLAVGAALLLAGNPMSILLITLCAFVATEIGYSIWSTTTSSSLLRIIPTGHEGSLLGINSAFVGAGLLIGSLAAGEVSAAFGYAATFSVAIVIALASFLIISKFFKKTVVVARATA